jgi:hypothetical protein
MRTENYRIKFDRSKETTKQKRDQLMALRNNIKDKSKT